MLYATVAGRVRRSCYQRAEALSAKQAQRDLRELTEADLLKAVVGTRGRYYVPGATPSRPTSWRRAGDARLTNPHRD